MVLKRFLIVFVFLVGITFAAEAMAKEKLGHKVYPVSPPKIMTYLESLKGRKKILFIYHSESPQSQDKIRDIMDLARISKSSVVAISEDVDYLKFSRYIKKFKEIPFRVIVNNQRGPQPLEQLLAPLGVQPWQGNYPTMVMMDEENKAVKQGFFTLNEMGAFLFEVPKEEPKAKSFWE